VVLWTGSFESIVIYSGVGVALFSMLAVSSVHILRRTRPDLPRPFRTPGYPIVPGLFLSVMGILSLMAFVQRPWASFYSLLSILAGLPVYYLWVRPQARSARRPIRAPEAVEGAGIGIANIADD
jgi:APA family basic amino acid/polyamine antiporter